MGNIFLLYYYRENDIYDDEMVFGRSDDTKSDILFTKRINVCSIYTREDFGLDILRLNK